MYSVEQVAHFMRDGGGCDATSVRGYGMGESTVAAQHRTAKDLWEKALALTGNQALSDSQRDVAERELARHTAALAPLTPVNPARYGPPPDFKGQPV